MQWHTETVVAIYKAIIRRESLEQIEAQRLQMIAASFSNPTWNEKGNDHSQYLAELNQNFDNAGKLLYAPKSKEFEIDWNKPWFAAAKRGLERTRQKYAWAQERKLMKEIVDPEQIEARNRGRKEIDQLN